MHGHRGLNTSLGGKQKTRRNETIVRASCVHDLYITCFELEHGIGVHWRLKFAILSLRVHRCRYAYHVDITFPSQPSHHPPKTIPQRESLSLSKTSPDPFVQSIQDFCTSHLIRLPDVRLQYVDILATKFGDGDVRSSGRPEKICKVVFWEGEEERGRERGSEGRGSVCLSGVGGRYGSEILYSIGSPSYHENSISDSSHVAPHTSKGYISAPYL
jgi:hypothetical protein